MKKNIYSGEFFYSKITLLSSGFTLVELMTVIVIIGILAGIGLPQYAKYTRSAKVAEGYTIMNSVSKTQKIFYYENGYFYSVTSSSGIPEEIELFSNGSKSIFNYAMPDGKRPLAQGSRSYFIFVSTAGDYDQDGFISGLVNRNNPTTTVMISTDGEYEAACIQGAGMGGSTHLTGVDLGLVAAPTSKYAYVVNKGFATLNGGGGGLMGLINNECTTLFQIIEAGETGEIMESAIAQFSIGE